MATVETNEHSYSMKGQPHPLETAGLFGSLWFTWLNPYIRITQDTTLDQSGHPNLPSQDATEKNFKLLRDIREKRPTGLLNCVWAAYGTRFLVLMTLMLLEIFLQAARSFLMYLITIELEYEVRDHSAIRSKQRIVTLILLLVLAITLKEVFHNFCTFETQRLSLRTHNGVASLLFQKLLRISLMNPSEVNEGTIINNLQLDCERFADSLQSLKNLCKNSLNLLINVSMGLYLFGWTFLTLILFIIVMMTPMSFLYSLIYQVGHEWMLQKDKRLNSWRNAVNCIRYIKLRGWELTVLERVNNLRIKELQKQMKNFFIFACNGFVLSFGPGIAVFGFLKVYFKAGYELEVSKIAIFIKLLMELTDLLTGLPGDFQYISDVRVGIQRLNKMLDHEEIDLHAIKNVEAPRNNNSSIEVNYGKFFWRSKDGLGVSEVLKRKSVQDGEADINVIDSHNDNQRLLDENEKEVELIVENNPTDQGTVSRSFRLSLKGFVVPTGQLTFLIGRIGSGKSTLLYSLLGETSEGNKGSTRLFVQGTVGFVGQKPWILNSTLKANILMDRELDAGRLASALHYSCLEEDLHVMEAGLEQETGENGDALSGGQRTRLAIARCLYQDPDIYIFDDILSALDSKVGTFIMEKTVLGLLRGKTVLMSTHAVQHLPHGHNIYLIEDGKIAEYGNFEKISRCEIYQQYLRMNRDFSSKMQQVAMKLPKSEDPNLNISIEDPRFNQSTKKLGFENPVSSEEIFEAQLMLPEDREVGSISLTTIGIFIHELGGVFFCLLLICLGLAQSGFAMMNYMLLSSWSVNFNREDQEKNLLTYLLNSIMMSSAASFLVVLLAIVGYFMSRNFNARMIYNVLHSKIEGFISRVPTARIMNRFSRDLMVIDMKTVYFVNYFVFKLTSVMIQITMFAWIVGKEMILMALIMLVFSIYTQRLFMNAKREVLRISSISKTPILNTLIDTCRGLPNIRSANLENWSFQRFINLNDESSKNELVMQGLTCWYSVRASIIVTLVLVLPSYLFIIYSKKTPPISDIVIIILVGSTIGWDLNEVLSNFSQLESAMIAVERCHHFEKIEPEPQYKSYKKDFALVDGSKSSIEKLKKRQIENTERIVTEGSIEFKDMSCKYATSQNPILSKLSFAIKPREKIGVIGRTGSGKSTLIKLLWRALDFYEGDIKIDGKSIKEVDLKSLRSQIMIVTQETALIEGTLRENIDIRLEDKSKDAEITEILTRLGFANPNYLKDGLDMAIDGEGSNLSAGEKQLISFARTLLDKKKIMILDEATANIDLKTEEKIQACVDQDFKDTTMLIIAHRIQTIMNCDRILILEKGKMAALDTPANLSNQKDSYFNNIINKMKEKKS